MTELHFAFILASVWVAASLLSIRQEEILRQLRIAELRQRIIMLELDIDEDE